MEFVKIMTDLTAVFGPTAAIVIAAVGGYIFFTYQAWNRELRHTERIEKLEAELRGTVIPMVAESNRVLREASECIKQNSRILERLIGGCRKD